MPEQAPAALAPPSARRTTQQSHYRELLWHTLTRLIVLYFLPLLLLAIFFNLQYRQLFEASRRAHLAVLAEQQANTFDLFLYERLVNLANPIDDPQFIARQASDPQSMVPRPSPVPWP
ncbi:MAG: hypothetical protein AB1486_04950 [Planctomycetota bacterium]